jgi:hypothetical protein
MIPARISVDEVERIVSLYRDRYAGWNVKHFHERAVDGTGLRRATACCLRTAATA